MARTIQVSSSGTIKRPLDEVRQQFADMAYHAAAGVRFTIVSQDAQQCRYRQEVTLLGMRQADELLNTWLKRWIAPLFQWVAQRALRNAFEEDRRDLESGAYARYRARTADAA